MAMGSKAYESPLISHTRMRAMYRALVEVRGLADRAKTRSMRGIEACWVGTAIDLKEGDLTSDSGGAHESLLLEHVRSAGQRESASALKASELKRALPRLKEPMQEQFPGSSCERVLCAIGAGMALKAAGAHGVAIAYVGLSELTPAEWKRVLTLMGQAGLPLVLMVLPSNKRVDLETLATKVSVSSGTPVPVIPVDAGDAVAIYRVAQETIVRARAGGGAAVILGVECGTNGVKLLGSQLVGKGICTERWVNAAENKLQSLLATS
jgi:TPP-dependent pyruvate/acetoin dehydrogenase alpha subunit